MTGRKQRYALLMRGAAICTLAVAVFVTGGCQEEAMSTTEADADEIPTVIWQVTHDGRKVAVNPEESLRLMLAGTFPLRVQTLDAEGKVIFEAVAHDIGEAPEVKRQTDEAIRVHQGLTREQVAAKKKARDERLAARLKEVLEEKRKEPLDKRSRETLDRLEKVVLEDLDKRYK